MEKGQFVNARGNHVIRAFFLNRERYHYDLTTCKLSDGWEQWDTDQDASYFGVWVHRNLRAVVEFSEGDESIVNCITAENFSAEIEALEAFHGPSKNPERLTAKQALEHKSNLWGPL